MLRRTAFGWVVTSKPAILTCPELGLASVQSMLMVVDLPAPLGPKNANTSPSKTSKSIRSTAVKLPKRLTNSRTETTGCGGLSDVGREGRVAVAAIGSPLSSLDPHDTSAAPTAVTRGQTT